MSWCPDLTVAAMVQRDDRFLVVEERIRGKILFNQPAGHVEDRESILDAVVRETFEETAWHFIPKQVLGLYLWRNEGSGHTTLRVAICGEVTTRDPVPRLDRGIIDAHWLRRDELMAQPARLRSPLVLRCIDDYLAGIRHDLSVLSHVDPTTAIARTA